MKFSLAYQIALLALGAMAAPVPEDAAAAIEAAAVPESIAPAVVVNTEAAQVIVAAPVRWSTEFGESIEAGSTVQLEWSGGDAYGYEVYYVPRWPGQLQYDFVTIEANTTATSIEWAVPTLEEYPKGTEFILGVKDGSRGPGFDWYDLTASIPLV